MLGSLERSGGFARVLSRWSPRGASHPRPVWGFPGSPHGATTAPPAQRGGYSVGSLLSVGSCSCVFVLGCLFLILLASAFAVPSVVLAQAGDAGAGKVVYERKCVGC